MEVLYVTESSGNQCNINAINISNGQSVASYKGSTATSHTLCVLNDDYIFSAAPNKALLNVFELSRKGQHAKKVVTPGVVKSLCVSNDGFYIAAGIEQNVLLWDLSSGELLCIMSRHYQEVTTLTFTYDAMYLISSGKDGIVSVWRLADMIDISKQNTNKNKEPYICWSSHASPVSQLCASTIGYRVYSASLDQSVKVHDISLGETLLTIVFNTAVVSITVDSTDTLLYAGGYDGRIYPVNMSASAKKLRQQTSKSINFEADDAAGTSLQPLQGHSQSVTCIACNMDCSLLASGSIDGNVKIWDVLSAQCLQTFKQNGSVTNLLLTITPFSLALPDHKPALVFPKLAHSVHDGSETDKNRKMHRLDFNSPVCSNSPYNNTANSALFSKTRTLDKSLNSDLQIQTLKQEISILKVENHKLYDLALNKLM
ncbi:WD repeat-containing protein 18 [Ciona intestinalis]